MEGKRNPYLWFSWDTGRKRPFERPGLDERMIFKCILKIGCEGMDFIRLVRDICREFSDELVGPIKCGTFLGYLKTYCFLVKGCAP
jgi:hypothetical protein